MGMSNLRFCGLTIVALGMILGSASPRAQEPTPPPRPTFRSAADVVTIQASVRDARGRVVSGLTSKDFEVRDNGELRPVLSLRSDSQSPLSVAIVVDMSGSMGVGRKIEMTRKAYDSVLDQLREGRDEVAIFTFDSSLYQRREGIFAAVCQSGGVLTSPRPTSSSCGIWPPCGRI